MIKARKILENINAYEIDKFNDYESLKLDSNESQYAPCKSVLSALAQFGELNISRYPAYGELINKIAQNFGLKQQNILPTNGADEALSVVINTFLEKGEELLCFMPTFSMPKIYSLTCEGTFRSIDYYTKWVFDAEKLISQVNENTKIIYVTSPNNPTGEMASLEDVEKILNKFPDKILLLDITYINFAQNKIAYWDLIEKYSNLIIVKSFSKDYALAGLRLGVILSQSENIINCKKVISPYSVNNCAVVAGIAALANVNYIAEINEKNNIARSQLHGFLQQMGFKPYKSEANFILCDFLNYCDFVFEKLKMANIKVRKFDKKSILSSCLRITVPNIDDLEKFKKALCAKNLLVFDLDGVVFDVSNSYRLAIKETFKYFAKKELQDFEIEEAKARGGLNCDWLATQYLLEKHGFIVEFDNVKTVFQQMFFNHQNEGSKGIIDNEKLLISKETFENLSKTCDFAVFTGRPKDEAIYSLEKFGILKYFSKIVTQDDLEQDKQKPHPQGLLDIKSNAYYDSIKYFGDTIDDIKAGLSAGVTPYGVIAPNSNTGELLVNAGAKKVIADISKLEEILNSEEIINVN